MIIIYINPPRAPLVLLATKPMELLAIDILSIEKGGYENVLVVHVTDNFTKFFDPKPKGHN